MNDLRKRIESLIAKDNNKFVCTSDWADGYNQARNDFIEALMKSATILTGSSIDNGFAFETIVDPSVDTHTIIALDMRPIEVKDTPEKLIEDLAKCRSDEEAWELKDRAKRLVERDVKHD